MDNEHKETLLERIKDQFNNVVGLPPGKYPDGDPKPSDSSDAPRGTLTSDDAEGLPPHNGTGFSKP
jgi:hypothetical protein